MPLPKPPTAGKGGGRGNQGPGGQRPACRLNWRRPAERISLQCPRNGWLVYREGQPATVRPGSGQRG